MLAEAAAARHPTTPPGQVASRGSVGPNAVIQTACALKALTDEANVGRIFTAARLDHYLDAWPGSMIPEEEARQLFEALDDCLGRAAADAVLDEAGRRTADYIIANRMPQAVARLLPLLPHALSARLLLKTIRQHAWTFAGSGRADIRLGSPLVLDIAANPLATPRCPWHTAILGQLFRRLVSANLAVSHTACCAEGNAHCRFEIRPAR